MAITFVGSASNDTSGSTSSLTLTLPAHQADDFAVIFCMGRERNGTSTPHYSTSTAGWSKLSEDKYAGTTVDSITAVFYKKLTSASETNPVIDNNSSIQTDFGFSVSVHIFRGVDPADPWASLTPFYQFSSGAGARNPTNPAITTDADNATILLFNGSSHDNITTAGAPSGYTLGANVVGGPKDWRQQETAYLLDAGTLGVKTPGAWTNTGLNDENDYILYTVALKPSLSGAIETSETLTFSSVSTLVSEDIFADETLNITSSATLTPVTPLADYYFDFDNGNDSNTAPYSPTNALKNLPGTSEATGNAVFNPQPGDILSLARGSVWELSNQWLFNQADSGTAGSPVIIQAHDRLGETGQPKPQVRLFNIFSSGDWTHNGSGIWYASLAAGTSAKAVMRVFGDWQGLRPCFAFVDITADTPWFYDSATSRLYIRTGSVSLNPNQIYSDVRCTSAASNRAEVLSLEDASNITFDGIAIWGGNTATIRVSHLTLASGTGNITFKNNEIYYSGNVGVWFRSEVNEYFTGNMIFESNDLDSKFTLSEDTLIEAPGLFNDFAQGVHVEGGVLNNFFIRYNRIIDFRHDGVAVVCNGNAPGPDGVEIYENYISGANLHYGRALNISSSVNNPADKVINTKVYKNLCHNHTIRCQFGGRNTKIYQNVFDTVNPSSQTPGRSMGMSLRSAVLLKDLIFANNILKDSDDEAVLIDSASVAASYNVYNNIIVKKTGGNDSRIVNTWNSTVVPVSQYYNNKMYSADTASTIRFYGTTYTVAGANAALTEFQDNIDTNETFPDFDPANCATTPISCSMWFSNYALNPNSDCIGRGFDWWGATPPVKCDGTPWTDTNIDIGLNERIYSGAIATDTSINVSGSASLIATGSLNVGNLIALSSQANLSANNIIANGSITFSDAATPIASGDINALETIALSSAPTLIGTGNMNGSGALTFTPQPGISALSVAETFSVLTFVPGPATLQATGDVLTDTTLRFIVNDTALTAIGIIDTTESIVFSSIPDLGSIGTGVLSTNTPIILSSNSDLTGTGELAGAVSLAISNATNLGGLIAAQGSATLTFSSAVNPGLFNNIDTQALISLLDNSVLTGTGALLSNEQIVLSSIADIFNVGFFVQCRIVDRSSNPRPNLLNLSWAWFDHTDPVNFISPTDQGALESTDATGIIYIPLPNTTLNPNDIGTLVLRSDDGALIGAYNMPVQN